MRDLRFVMRSLARDRRVALTAIVALALGIGSSTIVFSVFYNLLMNPYPYKDSHRLATFAIRNTTGNGGSAGRHFFFITEFEAFRDQNKVFEDIAGYDPASGVLYNDGAGARVLPGLAAVTGNTFDFYGVPPLLGRYITPSDGEANAVPVFVMNYRLWRSEFNGDPAIMGRTFVLNGEPRTLIGIMPARFDIYSAGIWIPAKLDSAQGTLQIVGRLRRGVSLQAAAADLDVIAHRLTASETPFALNPQNYRIVIERLIDAALGSFDKALYALLAAAFLLLLIACTNVANLLLARATVREREIALRSALGASRSRLVRQLLAESLMLSAAAGALGCGLAYFGVKGVSAMIPQGTVPREAVIGLNPAVLLFALGITLLTTLFCGLAPALHATQTNVQSRLGSGGKGVSGFRHGRLRSALMAGEVALSIVLLIGAGLLLRNFFALTHTDLPFDPAKTLFVRLSLPHSRYYGKPDKKPEFFQQLLPRIAALPGVISVTESLMLPPDEGSWTDVTIPGKPHVERWVTDLELCTDGYFQTLGLTLQQGRLLSPADVDSKRTVAVVNETLARKYFGGENPIGQKIKFEVLDRPFLDAPHNTYFQIVGVVADFKSRPDGSGFTLRPEAFLPASVAGFGAPLHIIAKTAVDPHTLLKSIYREAWAADPDVAFGASGSIADVLQDEFRAPEFEFVTLAGFAGMGLLLVMVGVFSVMSYSVSLRTREIGVRMALGAGPSDILGLVMRNGMVPISAGVVAGLAAGFGLTRFMASLLWGVPVSDPWAFVAAPLIILIVGWAGCFLPARRAARVDPWVTLRCE